MKEIAQIIDEIEEFLASDDQTMRDSLPPLAQQYAQACLEANKRLKECERLLDRGLRVEALQVADHPPPLLELVRLLDFAARPAWDEIVANYGLTTAPALLIGAAEVLNDAYVAQDPLVELLRQHRLLALGRAPLPKRIKVLARMAKADPTNPIWEQDLRSYETVRLGEMPRELDDAVKDKDHEAMGRLFQEVEDYPWGPHPQDTITDRIKPIRSRVRQVVPKEAITPLAAALEKALAAEDFAEAKKLRDQWVQYTALNPLPKNHPAQAQARPALNWVEVESSRAAADADFNKALADFEKAIDDKAGRSALAEARKSALRFGRAIPWAVEERYENRKRVLDQRHRLRLAAIAGGTVVGLVLAIVAGLSLSRRARHEAAVAQAIEAVASLREERKLEEAWKALEDLQKSAPSVAADHRVEQARKDLAPSYEEDQVRRKSFRLALESAEAARGAVEADIEFAKAEKFASTKEDRDLLAQEREKARAKWQRLETRLDQELAHKLDRLNERVAEVGRLLDKGERDNARKLNEEVGVEVRQLQNEAKGASKDFRDRVQSLVEKDAGHRDGIRLASTQGTYEARMEEALRTSADLGNYVTALEQYVRELPNLPRSQHFQATKEQERALWLSASAWTQLVNRMSKDLDAHPDFHGLDKSALETVNKYVTAHGKGADGPAAQKLSKVLGAVSQRANALKDFREHLSTGPMYAGIYLVEHKPTRRRFYVLEPFKFAARTDIVTVDYVNDVVNLKKNRPGTTQQRGLPLREITFDKVVAPQCKLQQDLLNKDLAQPDFLTRWETRCLDLIMKIASSAEVDAILRVQLLKRACSMASRGSLALEEKLEPTLQRLKLVNEDVNWFDPNSAAANTARGEAEVALQTLPDLRKVKDDLPAYYQEFRRELRRTAAPVGWLELVDTQTRRWKTHVANPDALGPGAELFLIEPGADSSPATWAKVGFVVGEENEPSLRVRDFKGDPEGRPVFAKAAPPLGQ